MQTTNSPVVLFWAVVRGVLGIAQMAGAITSLVLLIRVRAAPETVIALSITMAVTVLSILLFKVLKVQNRS